MTIEFCSATAQIRSVVAENFEPEILQNISVTPPYFALKNLQVEHEFVSADFRVELHDPEERWPITTSEVGRHMAILGSLALSRANPKKERHYYLANEALIKRKSERESTNQNLSGIVKVENISRKDGLVSGALFDSEENLLFEVEIKYTILHHVLFERMFAAYHNEISFDPKYNPYTKTADFKWLELGMKSCTASIGDVLPEQCTGHFRNYPALPVARIGSAMGKVAASHFKFLNPALKQRYAVKRTEIKAHQLVFVGEEVMFRSEIVDPNPGKGMIIKVIAYTHKSANVAESVSHFYY